MMFPEDPAAAARTRRELFRQTAWVRELFTPSSKMQEAIMESPITPVAARQLRDWFKLEVKESK